MASMESFYESILPNSHSKRKLYLFTTSNFSGVGGGWARSFSLENCLPRSILFLRRIRSSFPRVLFVRQGFLAATVFYSIQSPPLPIYTSFQSPGEILEEILNRRVMMR